MFSFLPIFFLMLTGDLRNKVDRVWGACYNGGITNPLIVLEQILPVCYLCAVAGLDGAHGRRRSYDRGFPPAYAAAAR